MLFRSGTLQDIRYDDLVDNGNLFIGSPDSVRRKIEHHFEVTGGFGVLLFHAGRDYATPEKLARSMKLFMDEVAPKVRHLDADARLRQAAAE